jgi:hypothetical protein
VAGHDLQKVKAWYRSGGKEYTLEIVDPLNHNFGIADRHKECEKERERERERERGDLTIQ